MAEKVWKLLKYWSFEEKWLRNSWKWLKYWNFAEKWLDFTEISKKKY